MDNNELKEDDVEMKQIDVGFISKMEEMNNDDVIKQIKEILAIEGMGSDVDDDDIINLYNILNVENNQLDGIYITQQSDEKNCFNRMIRNRSLENMRKNIPSLYNASYNIYSHPTKVILTNNNKDLQYQKDGGMQGNTMTVIAMIVNEWDINGVVNLAKKIIKRNTELIIKKTYIDDNNKGGSIRNACIDHILLKMAGNKYGKDYAPKKSIAAFDDCLDSMDKK